MRFSQLLLAALASLPVAGRAPVPGPFDVETVEIAPNVYGFIEKQMSAVVSSNIVAVIGNESVLVFDTGNHPRTTRLIIDEIKRLTPKPVKYAVISHWHDDHWVGNAEFAKAWPDIQIISTSLTSALMQTRKLDFRGDKCREGLKGGIAQMQATLANPKRPDGTPIPETALQRTRHFLAGLEEESAQCDEKEYRAVDVAMDNATTIDLGGKHVELKYLGRGNTAGDLVAVLPESRTVLTGDLLVNPFPFATQSYITEWAVVLRKIDKMNVERIVPGHGPVLHDRKYLRDVAEVLESISKQGKAAYTPDMPLKDFKAKIDIKAFSERFSHGDPFIRANFDAQMNGTAIERMWQELSGRLRPEGIF